MASEGKQISRVQVNAGGPSASFDLNVDIMKAVIMVCFIAYFLYSQNEFARLHTEIASLESQLGEANLLISQMFADYHKIASAVETAVEMMG